MDGCEHTMLYILTYTCLYEKWKNNPKTNHWNYYLNGEKRRGKLGGNIPCFIDFILEQENALHS